MAERNQEDWKIQKLHDYDKQTSTTVTIPADFQFEDLVSGDEVQLRSAGPFVVIRPYDSSLSPRITLTLEDFQPQKQAADEEQEGADKTTSIQNSVRIFFDIFPSLCMAGVARVEIERPKDDEEERKIDNLMRKNQIPGDLEWIPEEFAFEIGEKDYMSVAKSARDFIKMNFVDILAPESSVDLTDVEAFKILNDSMLEQDVEQRSTIGVDEEQIDRQWAIAEKNASGQFYQAEMEVIPSVISQQHVSKRLERAVDHVDTFTLCLNELASNNSVDVEIEELSNDFSKIFSEPRIDKQLYELSEKCFNKDKKLTPSDVTKQKEIFKSRKQDLGDLAKSYESSQGSIHVGRLITRGYELARCPRAIAVAGYGSQLAEGVELESETPEQ